jgi:non-ribosomal peptide synthetase component F
MIEALNPVQPGARPEVEPAMSLTSNLLDSVGAHADRVALRLGDAATTYRELDEDSARAAARVADAAVR